MKGSVTISFQKPGAPARHFRHDPYPPPYKPELRDVVFRKRHEDGSIDVEVPGGIYLSNGNGPLDNLDIVNLKMDMTVRYYRSTAFIWEPSNVNLTEGMITFLRAHSLMLYDWNRNVPTWKPCFYNEARGGALLCILCLKQITRLPKELIKMIAEYVYNSHHDVCWFEQIK
jgi:hypothetical protein